MEFSLGKGREESKVVNTDVFEKKGKRTVHDESESEDEQLEQGVEVTGFNRNSGGAVLKHEKKVAVKKELVVRPQTNENWRERVRDRMYQQVKPEEELKYGLNQTLKHEQSRDYDYDYEEEEVPVLSEHMAYERDVASRPDQPSLDDYAAVPVDGFAEALLRGIGEPVDDDDDQASTDQQVKIRPNLLGLGAKDKGQVAEELGAWGKNASSRVTRAERSYVPLQKVDKRTGRVVDEERHRNRSSDKSRHRRHRSSRDKYRDRSRERSRR